MRTLPITILTLGLIAAATMATIAQPGSPDGITYRSGYSAMMRLGADLRRGLEFKFQEQINPQPIFLTTDFAPSVELVEYESDPKPLRAIFISAGFVDLVNQLAHAKAINSIEKGYFEKYVTSLADENVMRGLKPLPNFADQRYWTDAVLNEQLSNFNSIVGIISGIKLSHHYLGQYKKYAAKLEGSEGRQIPINALLSTSEWKEALTEGVRSSLHAGCAVEGAIPFFEAFDKMPQRPPWAAYFLPDNVKAKDMVKQLKRLQSKFFSGH